MGIGFLLYLLLAQLQKSLRLERLCGFFSFESSSLPATSDAGEESALQERALRWDRLSNLSCGLSMGHD